MHDYTRFDAPLPHPGETLREDFLPQYGLTAGSLAKAMGLKDRTRIERVVREQQPLRRTRTPPATRQQRTLAPFPIPDVRPPAGRIVLRPVSDRFRPKADPEIAPSNTGNGFRSFHFSLYFFAPIAQKVI